MNQTDYTDTVESARRGDAEAFARLVRRFENLALGTAFGWLGDAERARDVSQEAFLDAYARLGELRQPEAFPGWFKLIVRKHCDRLTRRSQLQLEPLDSAAPDPDADLEQSAAQAELASDLRLAVGALPAEERIAVALTYFAELSGPEAAGFLEIPLSTLKKRLRNARGRLNEQGESLMQKSLKELEPLQTQDLSECVSFFVAVRQGDTDRVLRLLDTAPDLVNAVQEWEPELVTRGVLPFATRATALLTAIERDDLPMLKLLLDAGADVDGQCGCATGESPVWAATLLNRTTHLEELLQRGANPDNPSAAQTSPLHVAAMRGHTRAGELLLAHGAGVAAIDREGLTPADWARRNGHPELATLLQTDTHSGHSATELQSMHPDQAQQSILFTGIKAVDLFCPLPRGGLIRVPFAAGVGMIVLLGELLTRFCRNAGHHGIWTGFAQRPFDVADWRAEMAELGIMDRIEHSLADLDAASAERRDAFHAGCSRAIELKRQGAQVLLVLMTDHGFEADVEAVFPQLLEAHPRGSITTLLMTPFPETSDARWQQPVQPYAAQLSLDRRRAKRGLYPAVDPVLSWSRALCSDLAGAEHQQLAHAATELLTEFARNDPEFSAIEKAAITDPHFASQTWPAAGSNGSRREKAITLMKYLSQPFFVAEPFTNRSGLWVEREDLLEEVRDIFAA